MSVAGNIEAIRDWGNRFFYTKEEIADLFIKEREINLDNSSYISQIRTVNRLGRYINIVSYTTGNPYTFIPMSKINAQDFSNNTGITNPFLADNNEFKVSTRVLLIDTPNHANVLFGANSGSFYYLPSMELGSNKVCWAGFSYDGSGWSIQLYTDATLDLNKWYRVEMEWKNSIFYLRLYDSNDVLIEEKTASTTNSWYRKSEIYPVFGGINGSTNHLADKTVFDLANTYWTVNGDIIWGTDAYNHEES